MKASSEQEKRSRSSWFMHLLQLSVAGLMGFAIGHLRGCASVVREPAFKVHETKVDFENDRFILKTESVNRGVSAMFDVSRWVVTLTHKASGQSIPLLTSQPGMPRDPWDDYPTFSETADGFSYTSDIAVLTMKWPDLSFQYKGNWQSGASETYYLGGPKR